MDRYESPAVLNWFRASHAHSPSSKWLYPSAGKGGRGWNSGQLWMMSEIKEDVSVMVVTEGSGVALGTNLIINLM